MTPNLVSLLGELLDDTNFPPLEKVDPNLYKKYKIKFLNIEYI